MAKNNRTYLVGKMNMNKKIKSRVAKLVIQCKTDIGKINDIDFERNCDSEELIFELLGKLQRSEQRYDLKKENIFEKIEDRLSIIKKLINLEK